VTLLHPGDAINITAVPYGVLAVPQGEARYFQREVDIVLLRSHPRVATITLRRSLSMDLAFLLNELARWDDTRMLVRILRRRLAATEDDDTTTTTTTTTTTRRSRGRDGPTSNQRKP